LDVGSRVLHPVGGRLVIDRTAKVARCYFRPMPRVGGPAGEIIEGMEDAKGIPDSLIFLRRIAVPGTGYALD
jgi:hypothetical protein